jgi:hypothetical protein
MIVRTSTVKRSVIGRSVHGPTRLMTGRSFASRREIARCAATYGESAGDFYPDAMNSLSAMRDSDKTRCIPNRAPIGHRGLFRLRAAARWLRWAKLSLRRSPMRFALRLAAITLIACPLLARADDTYTFKLPTPPQAGSRVRVESVSTSENSFSIVDGDGKVINAKKENKGHAIAGILTITAKAKGKKPSKSTMAFDKAILSLDGKDEDTGLAGKRVTIERQGKDVNFKLGDGSEPAEAALKLLQELYKGNESDPPFLATIFPKTAVKLNETWPPDMAEMNRQLSGEDFKVKIDEKQSKGVCTLKKAYTRDKRPFAVIEIDVTLAVKEFGEGERAVKLNAGSVFTFKGTFDVPIDGGPEHNTTDVKLEMKGDGSISTDAGQVFTVKLNAKGAEKDTHITLPTKE